MSPGSTTEDSGSVVLVLTAAYDPTADAVVLELGRRGAAVVRLDAADFPQRLTMAARLEGGWGGEIRTEHRSAALDRVRSVYCRRPTRFEFPAGMSKADQKFAGAEARYGFGGVLSALDCRWLNHPGRIADAEYKPVQLRIAARVGLTVPHTLITNDPDSVRRFDKDNERPTIYKTLSPAIPVADGRYGAVFTSLVDPTDLDDARIRLTAHLFQELVPKAYDVRLTIVAGHHFTAAIHPTGGDAPVDWRTAPGAVTYRTTTCPRAVLNGALAMLDQMGLLYGAFDFVVTPEGEWYFVELNPSGQYGWIEDETGLPITSAIAEALLRGGST